MGGITKEIKIEVSGLEEQKLNFSCREARIVLRIISLDTPSWGEEKNEGLAAIEHYVDCKSCRDCGLIGILDKQLTCQEAILVWAKQPGALWMGPATLRELYAVEHVWGRYQWKNERGGCGYDNLTACREDVCTKLLRYWLGVPMSSHSDGASGVIHELPFLIKVFLKKGWQLNALLAIQKKRLEILLENIKSGEITVSSGHYHDINELVEEVQANLFALQELVIFSQSLSA